MHTLLIAGIFVACLLVVSNGAGPDLAKKIKNVKENNDLTEEQKQAVIARLTEGSSGAAVKRLGATDAPSEGASKAGSPATSKHTDAQEKIEDDDE